MKKKNKPKKPYKVEIAPQAQEFLKSIPPEDRQALMREFIKLVQDGTLFEKSRPVDPDDLGV